MQEGGHPVPIAIGMSKEWESQGTYFDRLNMTAHSPIQSIVS